MKKLLNGIFSFAMILFVLLAIFTIHGREIRQTELNNAFHSSMENAMRMLLVEEGGPQSEEEWKEMFVHSIGVQIQSASDLEVNILVSDMEKGILSAEAILHFHHPNGAEAMVSVDGTIYLEDYILESEGD